MKLLFRTTLAAGLLLTALTTAHAQAVPNGGYETWAARDGVDSPTGWLTIDDIFAADPFGQVLFPNPTGTFTKVTDVHGGTFALRLETKTIATLFGPAAVPGAVSLGNKVNSNSDLGGGLPFTSRPAMLQFYYKLSGPQASATGNTALARVELTHTVNGEAETIATAQLTLTTVTSTYVLAQAPLTYTSAAVPDSVHIVFGTADPDSDDDATVGTVLQIDDISFMGTATATRDAKLAAAISVWPNPSPDGRYVLGAT
ncbi:hypothetical protein, partial [uncultured Hymenobacter sp.]|uniref:hypothetical protein n=1 Tax=uncultured Hymenobacter sp. TaxID=170016 RepID=UPI0035CA813F